MTVKELAKMPFYFLSIFTWSKSFKNNPVIGSYIFNLLGLHVLRLVIAHFLFKFRLFLLAPLASKEDRYNYQKNGFIIKHDFLPEEEFQNLKNELLSYHGNIREIIEGDTISQKVSLNDSTLLNLPMCRKFVEDKRLSKLMRYASSKNRFPNFYIENIKQHALHINETDPQKQMHSDTFHPTTKAWFFIDDVSDNNGPFMYVPGSNRLTWERIKWEYAESLISSLDKKSSSPDRYWDGSFRISEGQLQKFSYAKPISFQVPPNTLLIANTHGFHCRGDAKSESSRMSIWMLARDNPFNPFFSPFPNSTAKIFEYFWNIYIRKTNLTMEKSVKIGSFKDK